jgi:hypothetical protein
MNISAGVHGIHGHGMSLCITIRHSSHMNGRPSLRTGGLYQTLSVHLVDPSVLPTQQYCASIS